MAAVAAFPARPEGFSATASRLLGCPGQDSGILAEAVSRCEALLNEIRRSCGADGA